MLIVEGRTDVGDVDAFVADLAAIGDEHSCAVQAFDARYVAGRRHLEAAVERANRAFERDDAIADDRAVEILCYAAGRRQIQRAIEMGVSEGELPVAVVVDGVGDPEADESSADEHDAVAAIRELIEPADVVPDARDEATIREFFGITDAEIGATDASLEDLVIERVALLVVEK